MPTTCPAGYQLMRQDNKPNFMPENLIVKWYSSEEAKRYCDTTSQCSGFIVQGDRFMPRKWAATSGETFGNDPHGQYEWCVKEIDVNVMAVSKK